MIKPEAILVHQESGRLFEIEFYRGELDEEILAKGDGSDPVVNDPSNKPVLEKFDYRNDFLQTREQIEKAVAERKLQEQLEAEEEEKEKAMAQAGKLTKGQKPAAAKKTAKKTEKKGDKNDGLEGFNFNFYTSDLSAKEKRSHARAENGEIVLEGLELPPNFPQGSYFFKASDISNFDKLSSFVLPSYYQIQVSSTGKAVPQTKKKGKK